MKQHFSYDNNNNIKNIAEGKSAKSFEYDKNNQLTKTIIPGQFMETKATPATIGPKTGDYLGKSRLDFSMDTQAIISLDYDAPVSGSTSVKWHQGLKR